MPMTTIWLDSNLSVSSFLIGYPVSAGDPSQQSNCISSRVYRFNFNLGGSMKIFIAFIAGIIIGGAGVTFSDVARLADRGVDSAKAVVKDSVKQ
jgi:hypothetical protein